MSTRSQGPAFFHHLPNSKQVIRQHNKLEQRADMKHFEPVKKRAPTEVDLLKLQAQANKLDKESIKMILSLAR